MHAAVTRRVVVGGALVAAGAGAIGAYEMLRPNDYERLIAEQARPLPDDPGIAELVRYATLAANSHNTQAWLFRAGDGGVDILPDTARRTPVVDPDDHHLYASLGCAAENLSIAARGSGRSGEIRFDAGADGSVNVALEAAPVERTALLDAIPKRQCTRATYDGTAVGSDVIARLEAAVRSAGVEPIFITEARRREDILALVVAGNSAQLDDRAYTRELKSWLRFNSRAAAATRDGLFSAASGNPTLPSWLGPIMYDLAVNKDGENRKVIEQVRSSSGLIVLVAPSNDKAGWVAAGRACQRLALQATADGLKYAFVNQAVEVPEVRRELQSLLGLGGRRPNLVLRFGHGPDMPRSLRRDVASVMVGGKAS